MPSTKLAYKVRLELFTQHGYGLSSLCTLKAWKVLIFFSIRLQQPAVGKAGDQPLTVEEALYVLGKNILGKNVTDRLFPVAKTLAKGMGHIGK